MSDLLNKLNSLINIRSHISLLLNGSRNGIAKKEVDEGFDLIKKMDAFILKESLKAIPNLIKENVEQPGAGFIKFGEGAEGVVGPSGFQPPSFSWGVTGPSSFGATGFINMIATGSIDPQEIKLEPEATSVEDPPIRGDGENKVKQLVESASLELTQEAVKSNKKKFKRAE